MELNIKISWYYCLFSMIPLIVAIYQILDYFTFKAIGISSVIVVICFSMFFFLRRSFEFTLLTVVLFYIIGFTGALFIAFFKQEWLILPIVLAFWVSLQKTIKSTRYKKGLDYKIKMEESKGSKNETLFMTPTRFSENKRVFYDILIVLLFFVTLIFVFTSLFNIFS
ncbi:MAG: hypothetical protein ACQERD_07815 [Campylobacterota bacterium]